MPSILSLFRTESTDRTAIGDHRAAPPFLLITREIVQFSTASDYSLDVEALSDPDASACVFELYLGDFLEGFYVRDAPEFEEWALLQREGLHRQAMEALVDGGLCRHIGVSNSSSAKVKDLFEAAQFQQCTPEF